MRVCVSVCLSAAAFLHYCTDPDVTWEIGRGCPLAVHYWADLQSVHGLRCYGNITRTPNVNEYMLVLALCLVTFRVSRRRREMYCGHARRVCVCLSVCLSVRGRMPTLLHGPRFSLGGGGGCPRCVLLGGFAISARVALLWQHYANAKC